MGKEAGRQQVHCSSDSERQRGKKPTKLVRDRDRQRERGRARREIWRLLEIERQTTAILYIDRKTDRHRETNRETHR